MKKKWQDRVTVATLVAAGSLASPPPSTGTVYNLQHSDEVRTAEQPVPSVFPEKMQDYLTAVVGKNIADAVPQADLADHVFKQRFLSRGLSPQQAIDRQYRQLQQLFGKKMLFDHKAITREGLCAGTPPELLSDDEYTRLRITASAPKDKVGLFADSDATLLHATAERNERQLLNNTMQGLYAKMQGSYCAPSIDINSPSFQDKLDGKMVLAARDQSR